LFWRRKTQPAISISICILAQGKEIMNIDPQLDTLKSNPTRTNMGKTISLFPAVKCPCGRAAAESGPAAQAGRCQVCFDIELYAAMTRSNK